MTAQCRFVSLACVALVCVAGHLVPSPAADPDVETRVRVAIAVASASAAPSPDTGECGLCRTDIDACRAEAIRDGRPIVLFVAGEGCERRAAGIPNGTIPCRVPEYDCDGLRPTEKRVVVLLRGTGTPDGGTDTGKLYVRATLPGDSTASAIATAIASVKAAGVSEVKWNFGVESDRSAKPTKASVGGECRTCVQPPTAPYARFLRR